MNIALILAAGVGQRMRSGGLPKQFLNIMGKPIIIYTLEKFDQCDEVDQIVVVCHGSYLAYMDDLLSLYRIKKARKVIVGGCDRQSSLKKGLEAIVADGGKQQDIVMIHDGVRPLVGHATIVENIRVAKRYGCAITTHPVTESVVISEGECAVFEDFKKRSDTYSLTSPQTFRLGDILDAYNRYEECKDAKIPLLDAAMVYSEMGGEVHLVKELNTNLKITTPEDVYYLRAILDLEESKYIFGL
ncbi:MAG: 2-C-methyl-D-erythritol 4-phosphate cytidylyltransferase [Ruminococcus sp.]|nr:2-C-methyl-D-erythritol 4-phosphate cytidylyltransferase [Ruminococcus sp.]